MTMFRRTLATATSRHNMLILSESDVRECLSVSTAITANRLALSSLLSNGDGGAVVPTRIGLQYNSNPSENVEAGFSNSTPDWSLFKPAAYYPSHGTKEINKGAHNIQSSCDDVIMGMKLVSIRANNPSKFNKPTVPATIMLLHPETGEVSAIVAATYLTAARTAAGSALATALALANNPLNIADGLTLVVFGAGLQAELHIRCINYMLKLKAVVIINRSMERANNLKDNLLKSNQMSQDEIDTTPIITNISTVLLSNEADVCDAVKCADIIVTATNTCTPLFEGSWVKPKCHINGIGSYTPLMKEVDDFLVKRCEVLIDTKEALDVGDLSILKHKDNQPSNYNGLIGDAIVGNTTFGIIRDDPDNLVDCTLYKSVGTAIQDVVSAQFVLDIAKMNKKGVNVNM